MKYRVGIITKTGEPRGKAFEIKQEAEDYILDLAEKEGIKQARIKDLMTGIEESINFE
jgi:hypothetical protein